MRKFNSAQLKIDRAVHHIGELDVRRDAFLVSKPCKVRPQYDPQADLTNYIVQDVAEVDPIISLIIGDIFHNLRSALDHLAAALVLDNGGTVGSNTYFPISKSVKAYASESRAKMSGMSVTDQKTIDSFQPYFGGNDALWGLHRMDIADKHSLILVHTQCLGGIKHRISEAEIAKTMGPGFFGDSLSTEKTDVLIPLRIPVLVPKKGDVLFGLAGNTEKNEDMQPSFDIAFGNVEVFNGRLVRESILEITDLVQRIVKGFI